MTSGLKTKRLQPVSDVWNVNLMDTVWQIFWHDFATVNDSYTGLGTG